MSFERPEVIDLGDGYFIEIVGEWAVMDGPMGIVFDVKSEDGHPRLRRFAADMIARLVDTPPSDKARTA